AGLRPARNLGQPVPTEPCTAKLPLRRDSPGRGGCSWCPPRSDPPRGAGAPVRGIGADRPLHTGPAGDHVHAASRAVAGAAGRRTGLLGGPLSVPQGLTPQGLSQQPFLGQSPVRGRSLPTRALPAIEIASLRHMCLTYTRANATSSHAPSPQPTPDQAGPLAR